MTQDDTSPEGPTAARALHPDEGYLFEQAIEQSRMALCISDPFQDDCPIVMVNRAFVDLTGYDRDEVIGRNCRFLQGPATDPAAVQRLRDALADRTVKVIELLNYRKDGSPFWNALHVGPIFDRAGNLTHLYGSQRDVTDLVEARERLTDERRVTEELRHRARNLFAVMSSIVKMSARQETDAAALARQIMERLQALGRAHEISLVDARAMSTGAAPDLQTLAETILRPYRGDTDGRVEIAGPDVALEPGLLMPMGLVLHELSTDALERGAFTADDARVRIAWTREGDMLRLTWSDCGMPGAGNDDPSRSGSRLMTDVIAAAGGTIALDRHAEGLRATITLPLG